MQDAAPGRRIALLLAPGIAAVRAAPACRSVYSDVMAGFGRQKRHILTRRVEPGREAQQEAQPQLQTPNQLFLVTAMHRAERKMNPVRAAFRDPVLFLKHSRNARAIASPESTPLSLEDDVADLVREREAAIHEARTFVAMREG